MTTTDAHLFHLPRPAVADDAAAARGTLRAQIARLESELGAHAVDARPLYGSFAEMIRANAAAGEARTTPAAPRLLGLAELEAERDRLATALRQQRETLALRAGRQEEARRLREEILRDPEAHAGVRVSNAEVGEPGCHDWHVRPRFGVLGMLMRWWRVKISSGCP